MSKKTLIVVGNGMVGHHFLEQFCASPAAADFEIIVFGEEKQLGRAVRNGIQLSSLVTRFGVNLTRALLYQDALLCLRMNVYRPIGQT